MLQLPLLLLLLLQLVKGILMVIEVGEVVVGDHMVKAGLVGIAIKTKVLVQLCIMKGVNYLSRGIFLLLIGRALCLLLMSLRNLICLIPLLIVYKTMTPRKLSWTIQKRIKIFKVLLLNLSNSLIHFRKAIKDQSPLLQRLVRRLIKVFNISLGSK